MIGVSYTMSDLLRTFRDLFRDSEEVTDWCIANYGQKLKIGVGADERREWGNEDAPFLVIVPSYIATGMSQSSLDFTFEVDVAVSELNFSDFEYSDTMEMEGIYKLDELLNLVIEVMNNGADQYNAVADQIDIGLDSSMFFPLHVATLTVTINNPHLLGGYRIGL